VKNHTSHEGNLYGNRDISKKMGLAVNEEKTKFMEVGKKLKQ
jgi:hypothetical protein